MKYRDGTNILKAQRGQALAEFSVIAGFVLVPLFFCLPLLGKFVDLRHKSEMASRYSAWERTVWFAQQPRKAPAAAVKTASAIERELHFRVFADHKTVLDSRHASQELEKLQLDPLLKIADSKTGRLIPLLKDLGGKRLGVYTESETEPPGFLGDIAKAMGLVDKFGFSVNSKARYTSTVNSKVIDIPRYAEFDKLGLAFGGRHVLVADGWNAGGPAHEQEQVRHLLPTEILDNEIGEEIQAIVGLIPWMRELDSDSLCFGHSSAEPVPEQRLGRGRHLPPPGSC